MNKYFFVLMTFCIWITTASTSCKVKTVVNNTVEKNEIDLIKSDKDVISFMLNHFEKYRIKNDKNPLLFLSSLENFYRDEKLLNLIDSLKPSTWKIKDFNSDNINDLLVHGPLPREPIVVLGSYKNKYTILELRKNRFGNEFFPVVQTIGGKNLLRVYEPIFKLNTKGKREKILKEYLLMIEDKSLVEYPIGTEKVEIEKISYFQICSGKCPTFMMNINSQGALYLAEMSYNQKKGFYDGKISLDKFKITTDWIQNLNFQNLESSYKSGYTHSVPARIVIKYNNGKIKEIKDDGKSGTYGLRSLYSRIMKIYEESDFTFASPISADNSEVDLDTLMY